MLSRIHHLLSAVMLAFIFAFVGHSLYLCIDFLSRPHLYAAHSAPWYTGIWVNGLITALFAFVFFLLRLLVQRFMKEENA